MLRCRSPAKFRSMLIQEKVLFIRNYPWLRTEVATTFPLGFHREGMKPSPDVIIRSPTLTKMYLILIPFREITHTLKVALLRLVLDNISDFLSLLCDQRRKPGEKRANTLPISSCNFSPLVSLSLYIWISEGLWDSVKIHWISDTLTYSKLECM